MSPYWSWLLTAVGVTGLYYAGKKRPWAWFIGLGAQVLWLAYALATKQYGFIVSAFAYGWVYAKNGIEWMGWCLPWQHKWEGRGNVSVPNWSQERPDTRWDLYICTRCNKQRAK